MRRMTQSARDDLVLREALLATCIRSRMLNLDPASLSKSYGVPEERVREIIKRNGGSIG